MNIFLNFSATVKEKKCSCYISHFLTSSFNTAVSYYATVDFVMVLDI